MKTLGAANRRKERVQHDLLGLPSHAQKRGNQCRQGQLAAAGEGVGMVRMSRRLRELSTLNVLSKVKEQGLYEFTAFKSSSNDSLSRVNSLLKSTTYVPHSNTADLSSVDCRHGAHLGELVRYADDFVVMCRTAQSCEEAQGRIEHVLTKLGLKLHPQKTRRVDLTDGLEGFDFLGCHLHKRMSGRLWQQKGLRRYYLQRWPSRKAMNRVRERVRELTPRKRCHRDVRSVIAELNPVLRGWGQYFGTGNAADHFTDVDEYVVKRLRSLRVKRAGRHLRAGQTQHWDRDYFESLGLHRLRGTIRYLGKPPGNRRPA